MDIFTSFVILPFMLALSLLSVWEAMKLIVRVFQDHDD